MCEENGNAIGDSKIVPRNGNVFEVANFVPRASVPPRTVAHRKSCSPPPTLARAVAHPEDVPANASNESRESRPPRRMIQEHPERPQSHRRDPRGSTVNMSRHPPITTGWP